MTEDPTAINSMSGSPLNRFSWLRSSSKAVESTVFSPRARWLLYRSGDPLVNKKTGSPVELSTNHIERLLGSRPFFGQGEREGDVAPDGTKMLESARLRGPTAVFLGVWERKNTDTTNTVDANEDSTITDGVQGDAYFALDVSNFTSEILQAVHADAEAKAKGTEKDSEVDYVNARIAASRLGKEEGAIFAAAKAMLDWNSRNKVR